MVEYIVTKDLYFKWINKFIFLLFFFMYFIYQSILKKVSQVPKEIEIGDMIFKTFSNDMWLFLENGPLK